MPDPQSSTSHPSPTSRKPIILQVGERRFTTTHDTLTDESLFFKAFLSGFFSDTQEDGSYFLDADPELFSHILRYLRRAVLPIFYDNAKGHDHALYAALLEEAKYFQIARLEKWLSEKGYLQAVTTRCWVDELEGKRWSDVRGSDEVAEYTSRWHENRTYLCPRRIPVHKGNPVACGRLCSNARVNGEFEYEVEEVLKTLVVRKQIIVDHQACVEGRGDDDDDDDDDDDN
ncbi:BTB POZ domain-containing protein [Rutstroemia sp. NJR-2017a BVV2]|nr:BTB POZ domain-containing protein [Rutstroemia sp. NJR-2017a BVV2]